MPRAGRAAGRPDVECRQEAPLRPVDGEDTDNEGSITVVPLLWEALRWVEFVASRERLLISSPTSSICPSPGSGWSPNRPAVAGVPARRQRSSAQSHAPASRSAETSRGPPRGSSYFSSVTSTRALVLTHVHADPTDALRGTPRPTNASPIRALP